MHTIFQLSQIIPTFEPTYIPTNLLDAMASLCLTMVINSKEKLKSAKTSLGLVLTMVDKLKNRKALKPK